MFYDIRKILKHTSLERKLSKIQHFKDEEKEIFRAYRNMRSFTPLSSFLSAPFMIVLYFFIIFSLSNLFMQNYFSSNKATYILIEEANVHQRPLTSSKIVNSLHKDDIIIGKIVKGANNSKWIEFTAKQKDAYVESSLVKLKTNIPIQIILFLGKLCSILLTEIKKLLIKYFWFRIIFGFIVFHIIIKIIATFIDWKNQYECIDAIITKICKKCHHFSVIKENSELLSEHENISSSISYEHVVTRSSRTGKAISETDIPIQNINTVVTQYWKDDYCCKNCGNRFYITRSRFF